MAKQDLLIRPHLSLPTKPTPPSLARRRTSWRARLFLIGAEACYLFIAANLGIIAYYLLAGQPVYKIVAWIIIGITWSNFASVTARSTTTSRQAQEIVTAMKDATSKHKALTPKEVLKTDTTTYLKAIREASIH